MKIKASDLHGIAILAYYWLEEHDNRFFKDEIETAKKLSKLCSQFEDEDELQITEVQK